MPWKIANAEFDAGPTFHIADASNKPIHLVVDIVNAVCRLYVGGKGPGDAPVAFRVDREGAALIRAHVGQFRNFHIDVARSVLSTLGCPREEVLAVTARLEEALRTGSRLTVTEDHAPDPHAWVRDLDGTELVEEIQRRTSGARYRVLAAEFERRRLPLPFNDGRAMPRTQPLQGRTLRAAMRSYTTRMVHGTKDMAILSLTEDPGLIDRAFNQAWTEFDATAAAEGITAEKDIDPVSGRISDAAAEWWRPIFTDACISIGQSLTYTPPRGVQPQATHAR